MLDFLSEDEVQDYHKQSIDLSIESIKRTVGRILRYSGVRILSILLTVGLGLYLTLMIINMGGYVDEIMRGDIAQTVLMMSMGGAFDDIPEGEREAAMDDIFFQMEEAAGLHQPLSVRTARWWWNGISLQWGYAERMVSISSESNLVKDVIFSRLPYTLLLVGAANVVLFFTSLWTAMVLSNRTGRFWDRLLSSLTPISSAPSWVHGVILLAIFALELRILPFKGVFDAARPENTWQYIEQILRHMVIPVSAIILSVFFQGVYTWRTFFMVHSGEDYVELAKAKGLPASVIQRRYLLRPTLPSVITSFAMMLISFWESSIALELLFEWPGIGALFFRAIYAYDRPVVVAFIVMLAYLLGFSVILLDIIYAISDPRVRVGGNGLSGRIWSVRRRRFFLRLKNYFSRFFSKIQPEEVGKEKHFQINDDAVTQPIRVSFSTTSQNDEGDDQITKPIQLSDQVVHNDHDERAEITRPIITDENQNDAGRINGEDTQPIQLRKKRKFLLRQVVQPLRENLFRYPMAVVGLIVIVFLVITSIGTVVAIPYDEAVDYWHSEGWLYAPKLSQPAWTNLFRREKWPKSIYFNSLETADGVVLTKEFVPINDEMTDIRMTIKFDYTADVFPQDLVVYFDSSYEEKAPFASLIMITPDGREVDIKNFKATHGMGYILSHEDKGVNKKVEVSAVAKVFGDPESDFTKPVKGHYELQILTIVFEEFSDVDIEGVIHGKVFGLFGTDNHRRNLTIAMMWGTPVALTFGIMGALLTTTTTILIAAISAWFGGGVDEVLQRITELNITMPALPIAILVFMLFSKSIWVILAIMVIMNIFGNSLKEYRAMFLQFKESPYIEAAKAYGASNWRIIFHYLLPRIIQVMVPQLVISVPSYVFLEATLAYLGVVTPYIPTWGKVINAALNQGTFWGHYFWVLEPIALVLLTGLAFAFVGFALDKILNPRLRSK